MSSQEFNRPLKSDGFYSGEAQEIHEYLDKLGIPWKTYSKDGLLSDENGHYYLLPLIDRVLDYISTMK